ncbi:MAG: ABC transporter permease [Anaerolineaceae bacterium]
MNTFFRCLSVEILKTRRTLALVLTVLAPLAISLMTLGMYLQHPDYYINSAGDLPWKQFGETTLVYWSLLMLPLFITLEAALLANLEHSQKNWKLLYTLPVQRSAIYGSKLTVLVLLMAITTLCLLAWTILFGFLLQVINPAFGFSTAIPWVYFLRLASLIFISSWFLISFHLWISVRTSSFVAAIGAGIVATIIGLFLFGEEIAFYYPWTIPGIFAIDLAQKDLTHWLSLSIGCLGSFPLSTAALLDIRHIDTN